MAGALKDEVFGEFDWGGREYCSGTLTFLGTAIQWSIELDCSEEPTVQDFEDALRAAKQVYGRLTPDWELDSRNEAARQVLDSVYHQSEEEAPPDQIAKLVGDMHVDKLEFMFTPGDDTANVSLRYTSPKTFPNQKIMVQFDEHLKAWEVTLQG